ncbi:putative UPF0481 protein At3g02645 [Sesamum indicum]|uniref:UPF0481 protein At3g02645 n=1 Tax=Sesamum indicum TaxID=4182 RepID=A0A6I9TK40_SESIN|nr:putative UPF0481 protein At3g02645 [Sesamum indicum]
MSSYQRKLSPNPNPSFDEKQWVIQIRRALDEELEEETETPVRIFTVPKPLLATHPDSYIPHQVSVGPYHYTRPELREMERYKLAAAKRNHKDFQNLKLQFLVDCLVELEPKIRACYNKYLIFNGETLAWMMAVDVSFLFEFLQVCAVKHGNETAMTNVVSSRFSYLVGLAGNKAAHNAILRDISMLENQIPLFVLRKLLELVFSSSENADETLLVMLMGFCEELSPFRMVEEDLPNIFQVRDCAHLLDVLYRFCVPKLEGFSYMNSESVEEAVQVKQEYCGDERRAASDDGEGQKVWMKVLNFQAPLNFIKKIVFSKPMKMIVRLPWTILSNLPILKVTKQLLENFFNSLDENEKSNNKGGSTKNSITHNPPLLEEIKIPSVMELAKAGVRFEPTEGGISTITFDNKNVVLYLPTISLDVNSEVVLRNLVAYEACSAWGPLVLARYTELMNGIIDTEEDAKFLCERGIIRNHLKSDGEVADLWNGMSKSIRLTKVPFLDKVIEDVNKYHNGMWKVKCGKYMKNYVFGSWRILTFLAAILMLLFMALQAFCSVYNCARLVPIKDLD